MYPITGTCLTIGSINYYGEFIIGYTHYFDLVKKPTNDEWQNITEAFKKVMVISLIKGSPFPIQREEYVASPPLIDKDEIVFNGIGDDAHETMYVSNSALGFTFCKTNRKPYDFSVMVLLLLMKHYAPDSWLITSDGGNAEWQPAVDWLNSNTDSTIQPINTI